MTRTDPRLGRRVNHDPRSRLYPYRTRRAAPVSVTHERLIPVFDQGHLGSCTGNAAVGALCYEPLYGDQPQHLTYTLDEAGAVACYSAATRIDPWPGVYPPEDTGSDGLSVAKVLTSAGQIAGYQHTFSLTDALVALADYPLITGTSWYGGMFDPTAEGFVKPTGALAGGHEYVVESYDAARGVVGFCNSWGENWGRGGHFFMAAEDFGTLLAQDGDVTVLLPAAAPAPQPAGELADVELAKVLRPWATKWRSGCTAKQVKAAARRWLATKGL